MAQVLKQVSKISGVYGQPGEERVSQILAENLPEQYVILNSPRICYHGATFDIDHIIIGPNGIFVIETKNMQGKIFGGIMGNWVQERKRTGKNRRVKIGNPANQVSQYGKAVKAYLGSRVAYQTGKKYNLKIYSIVVFVHDEVDLTKMEYVRPGYIGRVKIVRADELVDHIVRREGSEYSAEDIARFADVLVPAEQRDQTVYISLDNLKEFENKSGGRYEIFEELGRGNFGVVFRGFDYKLDQEIALKKLPLGSQSDQNAVSRFYREAQIASGLHHDNIVGVYDYYEDAGEYYIVMELIEGQTLEEYARGKKLSVGEALKIIRDISQALVYAHQNEVIHRDLKLSNIMISSNGQIKVTDFGIAKLTNATDLTLEGTTAGTPASMSPEQITGTPVTEKSDLFSLGVMFYYLVTGKMPFAGEHLGEIVRKITYLEPVPPRKINPEISADLEFVILKALEKNPEERFENAAQFLRAVEELLEEGRLLTSPAGKRWLRYVPRFMIPLVKSPRKLFSTITVASLIIFVGILGFQVYVDSRQLSQEALLTKQYGFTNQNVQMLLENPKLYMGLPVNIVGRIDKIIRIDSNHTQFSLKVNSDGQTGAQDLVVSYNQPHSNMQFSSYIKISGSIQNTIKTPENSQTPLIIADKVEAIADPWSMLAPAQYTIYPGKTVSQSGKSVTIDKVEFAEQETRLFITVRNDGPADDVLLLSNPVAYQANRQFTELGGSYRISLDPAIQLQPKQEAKGVVFLQPLDRRKNSATFVLGSNNDILMGQEPYTFEINW